MNIAWLGVNVAPQHRRAVAIGAQQTFANTAGIVAGQVYRSSPYVLGNAFSLGSLVVSQMVIVGHLIYLRYCAKEKKRVLESEEEDTRRVQSGDRAADFEYIM